MNLSDFLLIDASSPACAVVALLGEDGASWRAFETSAAPALEGIFAAAERVRPRLDAAGFLFCEGPGSILGIRVAAAAIRGRLALGARVPVLAFGSLHLAAALLLRANPRERDFTLVAESRMNAWNVLRVRDGAPEPDFREARTPELAAAVAGTVFAFPHHRSAPPLECAPLDVPSLLRADPAVFAETPSLLRDRGDAPDAVNTATPAGYAKWTPGRHRA